MTMHRITKPHSPLTTQNSEGYEQSEIDRLNSVYVEAWNHLYGDEEIDEEMAYQLAGSLWDAVGNTDGQLTLILDRMGRK